MNYAFCIRNENESASFRLTLTVKRPNSNLTAGPIWINSLKINDNIEEFEALKSARVQDLSQTVRK